MNLEDLDRVFQRMRAALWPHLAAMGWRRYLAHGRGAVLCPTGLLVGRKNAADYMTQADGIVFTPALADAVAQYDPLKSIVLVFVDDDVFDKAARKGGAGLESHAAMVDGEVWGKVLDGEPAPPEAYRATAN